MNTDMDAPIKVFGLTKEKQQSRVMSSDGSFEITDTLTQFHTQHKYLLMTAITLITYYFDIYLNPHLQQQVYLYPHPDQLKLRYAH